jgi:hypothetical protein
MGYMGFDAKIADAVLIARLEKLWRKANEVPRKTKKRKPRFCLPMEVRLCPRQRSKQLKTCGG